MKIKAGARSSPLSRAQVEEVLAEMPSLELEMVWMATSGDLDKKTSLRSLGKTDFFTKELDEMLLKGMIRIAVHSAKDLPEPIPEGLALAAITKGVDARDSLVLREGETLGSLRRGAIIATSSERREEMVRSLRGDLQFVDLRGTIGERLAKLGRGEADGVVVAEAALIRLKLTHLNRIFIPGETVPMQGRLAILARSDDGEMLEFFSGIDARSLSRA